MVPYNTMQKALRIDSIRVLEDLIIETIYAVKKTYCAFNVYYVTNRDPNHSLSPPGTHQWEIRSERRSSAGKRNNWKGCPSLGFNGTY